MRELTAFIRCRNCGGYIEKDEAYRDQFCSRECSLRHSKCKTCGRYFVIEQSEYEEFCSQECRQWYEEPLIEIEIPNIEGDE